jgi:hypothetical protein
LIVFHREKEAPVRRCVSAGQAFQFLIEVLKAQAESETLSILLEEGASSLNVLVARGLEYLFHRITGFA